jgi:hypothetical protein
MATLSLLAVEMIGLHPIGHILINVSIVGGIFLAYARIAGIDEDERYIWSLIKQKFAFN